MIAALALVTYTILVATVGQRLLARVPEQTTYPMLTVLGWYLAGSWIIAASGLAMLLVVGLHPHEALAGLVDACVRTTAQAHEHLPMTVGPLALAASLAVIARWVWAAVTCTRGDIEARRRHIDRLRVVARVDVERGIHILDAGIPIVYCLAGSRPTIVTTTAALRALTRRQLAAVLDHERCHLRERHHLLIRGVNICARAFPFVPIFAAARARVPALLELRADDVSARRHGSRTVAAALAALATARPVAGLGAGGPTAAVRAHRLLAGTRHAMPWRLIGTLITIATGPLTVLLLPFCW